MAQIINHRAHLRVERRLRRHGELGYRADALRNHAWLGSRWSLTRPIAAAAGVAIGIISANASASGAPTMRCLLTLLLLLRMIILSVVETCVQLLSHLLCGSSPSGSKRRLSIGCHR